MLADGVKGARIAAKGPSLVDRKPSGDDGFDIAFEQAKADMKPAKTFNENAVKGSAGSAIPRRRPPHAAPPLPAPRHREPAPRTILR